MAPRSKISELPFKVRQELNERLLNGERGPQILPWLNGHEEVYKRKMEINDQNLSNWRDTGFRDYVERKEREEALKTQAEWAVRFAEATGGAVTQGAVAIAAGRIMQRLETASDEDLNDLALAVSRLHKREMDALTVAQRDQKMAFDRDRFRWTLAEKVIAFAKDAKAQEIANRPDISEETRIKHLLAYMDEVEAAAIES